MTNRVVLGKRGSSYGLFVSRPGYNVLTAGEEGMLLSPDILTFQIVQSGSVQPSAAGGSVTIKIIDLGFRPLILATRQRGVYCVTYNSNTSITIGLPDGARSLVDTWWGDDRPNLSNTLFWAVTNMQAF